MTNTNKLRQAIKIDDIKQVVEILRQDLKGRICLYGRFTSLHVAVKGGNKDVVEAVLDAGVDINASRARTRTKSEVPVIKSS